jgi:hypothetical protein
MHRRFPWSCIKDISLYPFDDERNDDPVAEYTLDPHSIRLLFAFSNLEVFRIMNLFSFEKFNNAIITEIALAWPHLRELELQYYHNNAFQRGTKVTLDGILSLASCVSLQVLTITLNPNVLDPNSHKLWDDNSCLRPGKGVSNGTLSYLRVGCPRISNGPFAVASFLSDVFPGLTAITGWEDEDWDDEDISERVELWKQTEELYRYFVRIRKQEREWAASAGRGTHVTYVSSLLNATFGSLEVQALVRAVALAFSLANNNNKYIHDNKYDSKRIRAVTLQTLV